MTNHDHPSNAPTPHIETYHVMDDANAALAVTPKQVAWLVEGGFAYQCYSNQYRFHLAHGLTVKDAWDMIEANPGINDCGFCGAKAEYKARVAAFDGPGHGVPTIYMCGDCYLLQQCGEKDLLIQRNADMSAELNIRERAEQVRVVGEGPMRAAVLAKSQELIGSFFEQIQTPVKIS